MCVRACERASRGAFTWTRQGLVSEVHSGLALPLPHKVSIREGFEWTEVEPPVEGRGKRCRAAGSHPPAVTGEREGRKKKWRGGGVRETKEDRVQCRGPRDYL